MSFREISCRDLEINPFTAMNPDYILITAPDGKGVNPMTAGWGGLGVMWGLNTATVVVRPQRYTNQFMKESEYFTLSFFSEDYRPQLNLCGSKSGRDTDKVKECGFTAAAGAGNAPYFEEADLVLVCRKRMAMPMDPAAVPEDVKKKSYHDDFHDIYWGEIVEALKKA